MYGQLFTVSVPSYTTYKISCIITVGYIWLHVSAVTRPSLGPQGIVILRYIHLVFFFQWDPIVYIKNFKLRKSILMVTMLLNIKYNFIFSNIVYKI